MKKNVSVIRSCSDEWHILRKLFSFYERNGHEVVFIGWDRLRERRHQPSVKTFSVKYIQKGWGYSNIRLLLGIPIWMANVAAHCSTLQADLGHFMDFDSGFPAAVAFRLRRIPYIYDIQDNYDQRHKWPFLIKETIRFLDMWVIKHAQLVIVTDQNRVTLRMRQYSEKILVMPNCPPDIPLPEKKPKTEKSLSIYAFGRLAANRGIDLLLDAAGRVCGAEIIMAGVFVEEWLKQKSLSTRNVRYYGWLPMEEALKLGSEADVIFSFYDPSIEININASSNKWYDAMMLAKPVITNQEIEKARWIKKEDIGYTCPYGSLEALIRVLEEVRDHPEIAEGKGRRGRKLFESEFNWSKSEIKLLAFINEKVPGLSTPKGSPGAIHD